VTILEKVYRYIDEKKDMYVKWLQELCQQPSIAAHNHGIKETAKLVEGMLQTIGAETEQLATSGNPIVYGKIDSKADKTLSFYNHYDVQPVDPIELWESAPFAAEIRDGRIYARGVADNKGPLVSRICAVHAYQQVYGKLPVNVKFIVEGEEEIGSPHLEEFAELYPDKVNTDGFIWENGYKSTDGRPQIRLGVKGMLYVELRLKGANIDLHSSNGAIIENPAWRLVWALNTLKNEQEEVLIQGFYDRVQKPNEAELKLLEDMVFHEKEMLDNLDLDKFLLNLSDLELKEKFIFQPTCTICGIETGYTGEGTKTVLPSTAKAKIDFRLVADQNPHEILNQLRNHLDKHGFNDIEIVTLTAEHPAKTDLDAPIAKMVIDNVKRVYGIEPQVMRTSAGTGPMYVLSQKFGIPAVGFGVGHHNSQHHAPNENIYVQDYIDGIKFAATVLNDFAK
jgi:acetylornithine deacetylase/succinyl-diaminopimelate desuccinylase-like protein